jgi:hypothetical protein
VLAPHLARGMRTQMERKHGWMTGMVPGILGYNGRVGSKSALFISQKVFPNGISTPACGGVLGIIMRAQ